jgi:putative ATP-grasp target RiPP
VHTPSEPLPGRRPTVVRLELDPETQTAVLYDQHGYPVVAAGKHRKTYEWQETTEDTEPDQDSADGKTHTDYVRKQVPVD